MDFNKEKFKEVLHYIINECGTKKMLEKQFYINYYISQISTFLNYTKNL